MASEFTTNAARLAITGRCRACRIARRLRDFTPEDIETALSSFTMRRHGATLSLPERRRVAEFLSGRPVGSYQAPLDAIPKNAYCGTDRKNSGDPRLKPAM